jgi:hypothetical protein
MASSKKSQALFSVLVVVVLIALVLIKKGCSADSGSSTIGSTSINENDVRDHLIQHKMQYTAHAKCRMACRDISTDEITSILEQGVMNKEKSNPNDEGCPSYAFEGKSGDGQNLRVVFAACPKVTKVVTCIDLGVEHDCDCK